MKTEDLKTVLYFYNMEDTVKFIEDNFYEVKDINKIYENIELLNKLPDKVLNYGIIRISSFEHWSEPGRHISILGLYIMALVTFYIQSLTNFVLTKDFKVFIAIGGIIAYAVLFMFVVKVVSKMNIQKERLLYLNGLLKQALSKKS